MKLIKLIGLETSISKNITIKFQELSQVYLEVHSIFFLKEKKKNERKNQELHTDLYRKSNIDTDENDRGRYTYISRFFDL